MSRSSMVKIESARVVMYRIKFSNFQCENKNLKNKLEARDHMSWPTLFLARAQEKGEAMTYEPLL